MDPVRERLSRCFAVAFPQLDPRQYPSASAANVKEWDSVAQLTLLTLIGEEFSVEIDFEEFEGATSFETLATRLGANSNRA